MAIKPTKRDRASAETREKILSSAEKLFGEYGYEAVGVKDIAGHAGVTTGAIYYHFRDKAGILEAIAQRSNQSLDSEMEKLDPDEGAVEILVRFLTEIMPNQIVNEGLMITKHRTYNLTKVDEPSGLEQRVTDMVEQAYVQGRNRSDLPCEEAAAFLVLVFRGCVYYYVRSEGRLDLRALLKKEIQLAIQGIFQ